MRSTQISSEVFKRSNRWTVSFFAEPEEGVSSSYRSIQIGELCKERRGSLDPQLLGEALINYIGLENVRSKTGELVEFQARSASKVKSRSKKFETNDVLFGRLRPELNKVYVVESGISSGLCSGEFLVLTPNLDHVTPRYLRYLLASKFVTSYVSKYKAGASLPRISAQDLMSLKIPLPPLKVQEDLDFQLEKLEAELSILRLRLQSLPQEMEDLVISVLRSGEN